MRNLNLNYLDLYVIGIRWPPLTLKLLLFTSIQFEKYSLPSFQCFPQNWNSQLAKLGLKTAMRIPKIFEEFCCNFHQFLFEISALVHHRLFSFLRLLISCYLCVVYFGQFSGAAPQTLVKNNQKCCKTMEFFIKSHWIIFIYLFNFSVSNFHIKVFYDDEPNICYSTVTCKVFI